VRPNGRFRIRWRDQSGRRLTKTFKSRDVAQKALMQKVAAAELHQGDLPPDPKTVSTLGVLATEWFKDREGPHNRNNADERRKWKNHLEPTLGRLRPDQVSTALLQSLIQEKLKGGRLRVGKRPGKGLSPATVLQLMRILSSLYSHLRGSGVSKANPVRDLPKQTTRKMKPDYDWRNTPYVQKKEDIKRIFLALPEPFNVAYAIGVMRGPRPGEVRALQWSSVDLGQRLIHITQQVRDGKVGPPKSGQPRSVDMSDELYPVIAAWHLKSGGKGLVIPPEDGRRRFPFRGGRWIGEKALNRELSKALVKLELPPLTWYEATKHTFASHFVRDGGSLVTLAAILGQSSTEVTKRYAHLRSDQLRPEDTARAQIDLSPGVVVEMPQKLGSDQVQDPSAARGGNRKKAKA
jgi:integrase